MSNFERARQLIGEFKGDAYQNGFGILAGAGAMTRALGARAAFVCDTFATGSAWADTIEESLRDAGVEVTVLCEAGVQDCGPRAYFLPSLCATADQVVAHRVRIFAHGSAPQQYVDGAAAAIA